jgi:hypothetical protein
VYGRKQRAGGQVGEGVGRQLLRGRGQGAGLDQLDDRLAGAAMMFVRQEDLDLPARDAADRVGNAADGIGQGRHADGIGQRRQFRLRDRSQKDRARTGVQKFVAA